MIDNYDLLGLVGVFCSIYSYAPVQWQRDYAKQLEYSLLNLLASVLLSVSLMHKWNPSSFLANAIWGLISLYGVYRCVKYIRRT